MGIDNTEKSKISFSHKEKIQSTFKNHLYGKFHIHHFSLNLFFGDSQSIFLSPTPKMAESLCKTNLVDQDSNYTPEVYKKFSIYSWRAVQRKKEDAIINTIKEEKFGMRSGMMIVRDLGEDRYAMYSFATHKTDSDNFPGQFNFLFRNLANDIAEMGDFLYETLLPIINGYTEKEGVCMPSISKIQLPNLQLKQLSNQERSMFEDIRGGKNMSSYRKIMESYRAMQTSPDVFDEIVCG